MKVLFWSLDMIFLICLSAMAQSENEMNFNVSGFKDNKGQVVVNIYREQDGIPGEPYKTITALIKDQKAAFTVKNIPYAAYAVIAYHDRNSNTILDHKFLLPAEPMGFSNNWQLSLFSGMPTFEKLKFNFSADTSDFNIQIE